MFKTILRRWARRRSYRLAVKEAKLRRSKDFKKYLVIFVNGEYRAVSKQHLKTMYKNGVFSKGVNFRKIESLAVYQTH